MLKQIKPGEGLSNYNLDIITATIVGAERSIAEKTRGADKFDDEGIIDVAPLEKESSKVNIPDFSTTNIDQNYD